MAELTQDLAWQADALELRATTDLSASEIGNRVDKHPATIRKLFARNPGPDPEPNADRAMSAAEAGAAFPIEGQTTVDDFTADYDRDVWVNTKTGEEHPVHVTVADRDPLEDFKAEAGEAVGPMPPREMDGGEVVETAPFVKGTVQLALDFGPNAAPVSGATIVFKSEKLASGFFAMGDVVTGSFTARITGVAGSEKLDKDIGEFVARPQAQTATITEIRIEASNG